MKNGEGYRDPTAGAAIQNAFRNEKQKLMRISSMRRAGQRECLTYQAGCMKIVNGEKKICPLKGDTRLCYGICASEEEIEEGYRKMFPEKRL